MIPESEIPAIKAQAERDRAEMVSIRMAVKEIIAEFKPQTNSDLDRILDMYRERFTIGAGEISSEFRKYSYAITYLSKLLNHGVELLGLDI